MYNNSFYNPQAVIDRINNQIAELERNKSQISQQQMQPSINQTFQLVPNNRDVIRYANSMEEVQREVVIGETPYFSKDMSVVWIKNNKGEIKTYELSEIIAKDDKDIKIEMLMAQVEELRKGMMVNEYNANIDESVEDEKPSSVSTIPKSTKKSK